MVFNDQLRRIAGVGDLYTIGLDGVYVLGMDAFFDAQQDKEEKEFSHIIVWLGLRVAVAKCCYLFLFV